MGNFTTKKYVTTTINKKKGEKISIIVNSLNGQKIQAGIIAPNGKSSYITTSSKAVHTFDINNAGKYKVFVKNMGNKTAKVRIVVN